MAAITPTPATSPVTLLLRLLIAPLLRTPPPKCCPGCFSERLDYVYTTTDINCANSLRGLDPRVHLFVKEATTGIEPV